LGISGVVALLAAIDVLTSLRYVGLFGFGVGLAALILEAVGAALMAWGAYQEYDLTKPATGVGSTTSAAPPTAPPSTPPPATPPAATPPADSDDLPPV
jgi:hypothetical protein